MSYNLVDPTTGDLMRVAGGGFSIQVGTLIQQYKKKPISGYLYCDGSTFDQNAYPALYMYLGSNVLPDYRECVMVGAEQNTTDTIATHDVYSEGEFKDDQLQSHTHSYNTPSSVQTLEAGPHRAVHTSASSDTGTNSGRSGTTTHGKQKAVYVYIKATSGLAEYQQDNVLNDVKNYVNSKNSYSTKETLTGGTWVDGKPIYRKVLIGNSVTSRDMIILTDNSILDMIKYEGVVYNSSGTQTMLGVYNSGYFSQIYFVPTSHTLHLSSSNDMTGKYRIIIEYTKTTD